MCRIMSKYSDKNRFLCHWSYHLLKSLDLGGYTNDSRARHPAISWHYEMLASIDKGTRGSAGRKCAHTASKPLRIHKVFSADFSLSASISAPAELLRIGQPWIFEGFLFFWTQAGCRPPRRKGQKAPKRLAVRRACPCESTL